MTVGELRAKYADLFSETTNARHKQWLVRRIAWRLQAKAEGDLTQRARERAVELANDADLRVSAPKVVNTAAAPERTKTTVVRFASDRRLFVEWDGVSLDEAQSRWQAAGLPVPTLVLFSGAGPHAYWRLIEPIIDLELWSNLQKQLLKTLGSDNIHDRPRVMRLPGFINQKPDRGQLVKLIDYDPNRKYDLAVLESNLPPLCGDDNDRCDFDDLPDIQKLEFEEAGKTTGFKPGQDFDQRGEVCEILKRNGWTLVRKETDGVERWRRPGKDHGISASLKGQAFYCFTTSTKIPSNKGHSPFAVLAYLEHNGDFSAAAKALAAQGFGEQPKDKKTTGAKSVSMPEPFLPFPVNVLPTLCAEFVRQARQLVGVPDLGLLAQTQVSFPAPRLAGPCGLGRTEVVRSTCAGPVAAETRADRERPPRSTAGR